LKSYVVAIAATIASYWAGRMVLPEEPLLVAGGALFLGLILWTSVEKLWGKSSNKTDRSNIFPSLNKEVLEKWGTKWAEQYPHLNTIILFDTPLKYPLDVKYVLYFEFDTSTPEGEKSKDAFNKKIAFHDDTILAPGFREVYLNEPENTYRDDWFMSVTYYPGFNEDYSWTIYKK
jgi:hypothetical protein